jgi:hypothetical protein
MFVDLLAKLLSNCAHGTRLLHASVIRVLGGHEVRIVVNNVVMVNVIGEVFVELIEEARFDQGHRRCFNSCFAL